MRPRPFGSILAALALTVAVLLLHSNAKAQAGSPTIDLSISVDGPGTSLTTPPFSTTAAGDVLVALVATDGPGTGGQSATVTGAGLTWSLARRVNTRLGTSEVWTAKASSILTDATVTSTETAGGFHQTLTVVAFANAGGIGATAGADAASGAPSVSLTTTRANSLVYAVGNDWDNALARTPGAGQAIVHQYLPPVGDTMWVQNRLTAVATAGTTVQMNDTAPTGDRWNFVAVEIVPPQAPGFLVVPYNDTLTAGLSDSVTFNMLISPFGGFTGPLQCSASAIPPDATGIMAPAGGPPHPGPIAMTVNTGAATPPGTYHPIATCTAGALSASAAVTLVVTSQPDYRVVLEPNSLTLTQGQAGVANFQVQAMNGFAQGVTMSATGAPAGTTATFTPASLIPSGAGTVQLAVGGSTPPAIYPLNVRAITTAGSVTRTATFTLTVLQQNASGAWRQQALSDTPAQFYGSVVGDPGNTGKTRVYASGGNGLMYEYSYNGTSWSASLMPFGVFADGEMHNGTVGPGRRDGVNRLYIAANLSGKVYEASWVNNAWQIAVIGTFTSATGVVIGDGRNDGVTRTYVSWGAGATELTWNGTGWTQVTLGNSEGGEVHCIDLATGRNDGINRIYTSNDANGIVAEYSWNGTAWNKLVMGVNLDVRNVAFGDGRNDGKIRGYAASADGNVYEYSWSGTAWQNASIGNAGIAGIKVHSNPVKAKGDNRNRVYAAGADGGIYEYNWTGTTWQTAKLGSATAYMYGLDQGDGLNKGGIQLYGTSYDGNAYLFEWVPATPPGLVTVPNVVGLQQASVAGVLSGVGLVVGTATNQASQTAPIGAVISQTPAGGAQVAQGSAVNITVSTGVAVPSVVNMSQANAVAALGAANLTASVSTAPHPTVPLGSVISQSPAAGVRVSGGSAVAIVVSTGPPPPVTVPLVVGKTLSAAQTDIIAANLTVGTITSESSAVVPSGSVIRQTPAGGSSAPFGSAVNLTVASGIISVNFVGGGRSMGATETAGPVPRRRWNNATGSSRTTPLALVDEAGAATTTTVTWRADNVQVTTIADQAGNNRLMRGYLDARNVLPTTVTFAGLPGGVYDVYALGDGRNGGATRTATYQISGPGIPAASVSLTDLANTNFNGSFVPGSNSPGNYVRFRVTVTSGLTLTVTPGTSTNNTRRAALNGMQIVRVPGP